MTGLNSKMQEAVNFLEDWATQNKMELNTGKTKDMWIGFKRALLSIRKDCSTGQYRANNLLHKDKTHIGICSTNLGWFTIYIKEDIERVQNRCLDIIGLPRNKIESLASRRNYLTIKEYDFILNSENHPCKRLIRRTNTHEYNLRAGSNPLLAPISFTDRHKQSFILSAAWLNYFNKHS
jgi:hypothetical protein